MTQQPSSEELNGMTASLTGHMRGVSATFFGGEDENKACDLLLEKMRQLINSEDL